MNKFAMLALAALCFAGTAAPSFADDKDVAMQLCTKELTNREGIPRDLVVKFRVQSRGGTTYEVSGRNQSGQSVVCKVVNGHLSTVNVSN